MLRRAQLQGRCAPRIASNSTPYTLTSYGPRHSPSVWSQEGVVSYERGTPVPPQGGRHRTSLSPRPACPNPTVPRQARPLTHPEAGPSYTIGIPHLQENAVERWVGVEVQLELGPSRRAYIRR